MPLSPPAAARLSFLLLLFCSTLCNSMILPFMGFFLVEGLGHPPWILSVYSVAAVGLTLIANARFGRRIDTGARAFPLIGWAAAGYLAAAVALFVAPSLWTAMTLGVAGFGLSASSVSTLFSLGGSLAERHDIERSRFNAAMRATTSTAWMIGPAATYLIADAVALRAVFAVGALICLIWIALWWGSVPRDMTAPAKPVEHDANAAAPDMRPLWWAAGFVFFLSLAHSLTFTALPIFYVREVGLPGYAPGLAFTMKTFIEVFAIFSTPWLIARFGIGRSLMATAILAVGTIQLLAAIETFPQMLAGAALEGLYYGIYASLGISYVQSFAKDRPARATALYWNTLMISGLMAGPAVGLIAQQTDFQTVIQIASGVALLSVMILWAGGLRQRAHA